jgi:23S rRNA pseudouridine1911/1915/1917 synthase
MSGESMNFEVPGERDGGRLDQFLAERITNSTRSALGRLIKEGMVTVDGDPAGKPGLVLREGMRIEVRIPAPPADAPAPETIPVEIVHEDDQICVVNKPSGLVVHPGHGRPDGTLVNALLGMGVRLAPAGGVARPGIVHPLDGGTSGLLVVAKTDEAHRALSTAFARREVRKRYLALVWGRPSPPEGEIERAIGRNRDNPLKMSVSATRGKRRAASSTYRTLESMPGFALVEVKPLTGRTHQIRVHLQSINHPLVGDDRYGGRTWKGVQDPLKRKALRTFDRLALHAANLSFAHPTTAAPLDYHAPLPPEFETLLTALRD